MDPWKLPFTVRKGGEVEWTLEKKKCQNPLVHCLVAWFMDSSNVKFVIDSTLRVSSLQTFIIGLVHEDIFHELAHEQMTSLKKNHQQTRNSVRAPANCSRTTVLNLKPKLLWNSKIWACMGPSCSTVYCISYYIKKHLFCDNFGQYKEMKYWDVVLRFRLSDLTEHFVFGMVIPTLSFT